MTMLPSLVPAIIYKGRVVKGPLGGDHADIYRKLSNGYKDVYDDSQRVLVTGTGKVLNRTAAMKYALDNDLIKPKLMHLVKKYPDLPADFLNVDAMKEVAMIDMNKLVRTLCAERAVILQWSSLTGAEQRAYELAQTKRQTNQYSPEKYLGKLHDAYVNSGLLHNSDDGGKTHNYVNDGSGNLSYRAAHDHLTRNGYKLCDIGVTSAGHCLKYDRTLIPDHEDHAVIVHDRGKVHHIKHTLECITGKP
jgi:hypothetical protein